MPPRTGLGLKLAVNPEGPFSDNATGPVNPLTGRTESVEVAEAPDAIMSPDVPAVRVKSGAGRTVRTMVVKCDPDVAFPPNVIVYVPGLVVTATATVTVTLAVPPEDSEAVAMLGVNDTPVAETVENTWTWPTNPLRLANVRTVEAEEPAWTVREEGLAGRVKSGLAAT